MKRNSFFRVNIWAYVAVPAVFVVLAAGVLGILAYSFASPYMGMMNMLISSAPQEEDAERDLLAEAASAFAADPTPEPTTESAEPDEPKSYVRPEIALSSITYPKEGDRYASITVEGTNIEETPVRYGWLNSVLNQGAGTMTREDFDGVGIPGQDLTIFIMAHNNTFFNDLQHAELEKNITVDTHYGRYVYKITDMQVVRWDDETAYDLTRTDENLIVYTCYPFDALGWTDYRYLVYCEFVSGPRLVDDTEVE